MKKLYAIALLCAFCLVSNAQYVNIYKGNTLLQSFNSANIDSVTYSKNRLYSILQSFSFMKSGNEGKVLEDLTVSSFGDTIAIETPYILDASSLIATFVTDGGSVYVNDVQQTSGETVNDFTNPVTYRVLSNNGFSKNFVVKVSYSGLPVLYINTPDAAAITSKNDWMQNATLRLVDVDGTENSLTTSIKGRGNSTWSYPKKSYALKLDKKSEILGMPSSKRWCLLANCMDRTMIRNAVSFEIARQTGLAWTPRGQFVEVVMNGSHVGNYYLCEQIKVDKNRVNIAELNEEATTGEDITGGYIFELDVYYDEVYKFKSTRKNLPWMFKDPDEVNEQQLAYVQQYVNDMEESLYDDTKFSERKFVDYMDLESFADWWMVYELAQNGEPGWPKSTYMNKDKNGKMCSGPVWDFDWGTFTPTSGGYTVKSALYYGRLFQDATFQSLVKERWATYKSKLQDVMTFIDQLERKLANSDKLNSSKWPITQDVNGDEKMSFADAVARLKTSYQAKFNWLDTQINAW